MGATPSYSAPLWLLKTCTLVLLIFRADGCSFARSGLAPPDDARHRFLLGGATTYPVLPRPVSTQNNAFVQNGLQRPIAALSGSNKTLLNILEDFATTEEAELCYWAWQALPPPRGGPSFLHPKRGYWDVSDGHNDQDIEWVQAYGEVAVSRLHNMISPDGPVVGAMCSMGSVIAKRRCDNGASIKQKCIQPIVNGTIQWPMAVSIWRIGHPNLTDANTEWRASSSKGHLPNIEWTIHTQGTSGARPWPGAMPKPGEISPASMPQSPWPASKDSPWGSPKISKVVRCADIPSKFKYHEQNFYCDHMPSLTSKVSSVDEAYGVWTNLVSLWPPTKPCEDDQAALDEVLTALKLSPLVGQNCSVVYPMLQKILPNFDCDNSDTTPTLRDMCCSQCGSKPIPDVPSAPAPAPAPGASCSICNHVYDPIKDGGGVAFDDLPDSWVCPICGAPKSAYRMTENGRWVH